mmetsp:Transcript_44515/g.111742  ORF Transcript_44515/g.111742 Transcript_44515/m.111742 type:complete len:305 (+) Transcript_44515:660-1574(+)
MAAVDGGEAGGQRVGHAGEEGAQRVGVVHVQLRLQPDQERARAGLHAHHAAREVEGVHQRAAAQREELHGALAALAVEAPVDAAAVVRRLHLTGHERQQRAVSVQRARLGVGLERSGQRLHVPDRCVPQGEQLPDSLWLVHIPQLEAARVAKQQYLGRRPPPRQLEAVKARPQHLLLGLAGASAARRRGRADGVVARGQRAGHEAQRGRAHGQQRAAGGCGGRAAVTPHPLLAARGHGRGGWPPGRGDAGISDDTSPPERPNPPTCALPARFSRAEAARCSARTVLSFRCLRSVCRRICVDGGA